MDFNCLDSLVLSRKAVNQLLKSLGLTWQGSWILVLLLGHAPVHIDSGHMSLQ